MYLFSLIVAWHLSVCHIYIFSLLFMAISPSVGLTCTLTFLSKDLQLSAHLFSHCLYLFVSNVKF